MIISRIIEPQTRSAIVISANFQNSQLPNKFSKKAENCSDGSRWTVEQANKIFSKSVDYFRKYRASMSAPNTKIRSRSVTLGGGIILKMIILSAAIWTRFLIFQVKIYISFGKWPKTRNCGSRCSSRGWWGLTFTPTADFGDFVFFPIFIFLKKIEISFNHTALILKLSTVSLVAGWQLIAQFADGHVAVVSAQRMNEFCFCFVFF